MNETPTVAGVNSECYFWPGGSKPSQDTTSLCPQRWGNDCNVSGGFGWWHFLFEKKPSSPFFLLVQLHLQRTLTETSQVNLNRKFCNILQHQLTQPFYIQFRSETASAQKHVETMQSESGNAGLVSQLAASRKVWFLWLPKNLGSDTRVFNKKGWQ